jgi:hypothetical protein
VSVQLLLLHLHVMRLHLLVLQHVHRVIVWVRRHLRVHLVLDVGEVLLLSHILKSLVITQALLIRSKHLPTVIVHVLSLLLGHLVQLRLVQTVHVLSRLANHS